MLAEVNSYGYHSLFVSVQFYFDLLSDNQNIAAVHIRIYTKENRFFAQSHSLRSRCLCGNVDVEGSGAPQKPLGDVVLLGLGVVLGHGEAQVLQNEHREYEQLGLGDELAGAGAFSDPSWIQSFWGK